MLCLMVPREGTPYLEDHPATHNKHGTISKVRDSTPRRLDLFAGHEDITYERQDFHWSGTIERFGRVICEVFTER